MSRPESPAERAAVVQEALAWQGTPYAHMGRVRGAGVDCGQFLARVYEEAGLLPCVDPEPYPADWMCHRSEERYLGIVEEFAHKVDRAPLPGDIVLYRWGRCISHGAIVVAWPLVVHSYVGQGVILDDAVANSNLAQRFCGVWSIWGDK